MQLTASKATPTLVRRHGIDLGVLRPGGPGAPAPTDVVAQAFVQLPMNFGAHAHLDVSIGAELGRFDSFEAARDGAAKLAGGRPTVGVVQQVSRDGQQVAYRAVELLVPDLDAAPFEPSPGLPGWADVRPTPLRMGADETRGGRFVESLTAVDHLDDPAAWTLVEVEVGQHARIEFEYVDARREGRFQPLP